MIKSIQQFQTEGVKNLEKVNSANLGWMFAGRGTAHAIQNVVAEVN